MAGWAAAVAAAAAAHYAPFDIYSQFEGINSACKYISAISALQHAYLVARRQPMAVQSRPARCRWVDGVDDECHRQKSESRSAECQKNTKREVRRAAAAEQGKATPGFSFAWLVRED